MRNDMVHRLDNVMCTGVECGADVRELVKRRKIFAELSGIVVEVNRHPGEWVEPSETVFRLLRMDRLRAEGFLHYFESSAISLNTFDPYPC